MAIQYQPTGDRQYFDLIRYFRPTGSQTVVFAKNMDTGMLLRLLRWGNDIYLPVHEGMSLGIGVHNGSNVMRGYPAYIEARNLWDGGPSQPEDTGPDHMWELRPGQTQVFDKLVSPTSQRGRPLIIQASGQGMTIGEASFGTDEFRGQIRVYEKLQVGGGYQYTRATNEGTGTRGGGVTRGGDHMYKGAGMESYGGAPASLSYDYSPTRGGDPTPKSPRAGIGAGAEVYQGHHDTGVRYQRNAQPVVFFRVEYQADLQPMLDIAWANTPWSWFEPMPLYDGWWDTPWSWRPGYYGGTAPEIPVARPQPHRPTTR